MRDNEVRLTSIYVAPTGSPASSPSPNSEDAPAATFDLFITGEEGDDLHGYDISYNLFYYAFDFATGASAPASFNTPTAGLPQTTGGVQWVAYNGTEDFFTNQKFTITIGTGNVTGHVLQYFAVLKDKSGDIVSFVKSEHFVLV